MTPKRAFKIATQHGSYVYNGDPGACFYAFHFDDGRPVSEAHRKMCVDRCEAMIPVFEDALQASCARDMRDLAAYWRTCPLHEGRAA